MARQLTLTSNNVRSFNDAMGFHTYRTKSSVVIKGLKGVYAFIKKMREDMLEVGSQYQIDIIIGGFDNTCDVNSTVQLPQPDPNIHKLFTITNNNFEEISSVIENQLHPRGGTDFRSFEEAMTFIQQNISLEMNYKIISYVMSDGLHYGDRLDILNLPSNRYTTSLGIGSSRQYDKPLLKHLSDNFVAGSDDNIINDSIIGDNFGAISKIASNVRINLITTLDISKIKTNMRLKSRKNILQPDLSQFCNNQLFQPIMHNNTIKLCTNSLPVPIPQQNMLFVFWVDKSGSMRDLIYPEADLNALSFPSSAQPISEVERLYDNFVPENVASVSASVDPNQYNEYEFECRDEFHSYMQEYFTFVKQSDKPSYFRIESDGNPTYYCNIENNFNMFEEGEVELINIFCDLYERFKPIKHMNSKDQVNSIKELGEYIGSPEINTVYQRIKLEQSQSRIKLYLIALIVQIKKLAQKQNCRSDRLLNQLQNMPMALTRTLSATVSSQYSQSAPEPDATPEIDTDNYDRSQDGCMMCQEEKRDIVYGCGHICACIKCTKQVLFAIDPDIEISTQPITVSATAASAPSPMVDEDGEEIPLPMPPLAGYMAHYGRQATRFENYERRCPICRKQVESVRKLLIIDENKESMYKCIEKDCINLSSRVSEDCHHLTFCDRCWKRHKSNNTLNCKCGVPITKYFPIFN